MSTKLETLQRQLEEEREDLALINERISVGGRSRALSKKRCRRSVASA